ncbi:MAG: hypothetical protein FJ288_05430 [Planctomycetes bacterium]|nr:hypothetical protein [Planctomycetota bacterium]
MAAWLLICASLPSLAAEPIEITASLDLTNGCARPGAYVPVRLKATNPADRAAAEVRVDPGGPVDTVAPWPLGPGAGGETVVPVFYAGGELRLALEFRDAAGRTVTEARLAPLAPRVLGQDTALVSIGPGDPEPDPSWQEGLLRALGAESLVFVRQPPEAFALSRRCGLLDARVQYDPSGKKPTAVLLRRPRQEAPELVQPEVYRLFGSRLWSAAQRLRLWLWLAVFALAAGAAALALWRRALVGAAVLIALGAAAGVALWSFGGLRAAATIEARVFHVEPGRPEVGLEHLACLESRGGAAARFVAEQTDGRPLPVPVLAASEDLFRPLFTLHAGTDERVQARAGRALVRTLGLTAPPAGLPLEKGRAPSIAVVARRADYVAGLVVNGNRASDASGHTQTLDAWAAKWRASADADLAYAGRSLAWWDRHRRGGQESAVLVWWRDAPAGPSDDGLRLPALAVYPAR